jgi:CheY-like chemotaxis protein
MPGPIGSGVPDPFGEPPRALNVLVVDDSAVVRQVMTSVLTQEPGICVTTAPDPIIAIEKMKRARPDVIVLDLEMPRMDGLTFLHKIMTEDPIPVVICSSFTGTGTEARCWRWRGQSRSSPSRKWGSASSSTSRPCCWWTPSGGRRGRVFGRRSDGSDPCSGG